MNREAFRMRKIPETLATLAVSIYRKEREVQKIV
jgi:hypothetical protein